MGFTIDIDTGGTFTDGFISSAERNVKVKVDTTPHDFTECFMKCIEAGAEKLDLSLRDLLKQTRVIRFSCTIGTNSLIQRKGPKIGLVVTRGHQNFLYVEEGQVPALDFLVSKDMIEGIGSGISEDGKELKPVNENELRKAVRKLLEKGARVLVVSLLGAGRDSSQEETIKNFVLSEYPRHYLGSIPVLLSSEVTTGEKEYMRTNTALTNAYLHPEMVRVLYKAEEDLRGLYYNKPLMIGHANGGVARVAKTKAIDTHNSGPVAGLMGSYYMSKLYNLDNVITVDIGGTSSDVGLITGRKPELSMESEIAGIPVNAPVYDVRSIGAGGGSIAGVNGSNELSVGPGSAGALPGPACYDLGGYDPTSTDADVVLGFIDPGYFLGGGRKLNKDKSFEAVKRNVAEPFGIDTERAAWQIHEKLAQNAAAELNNVLNSKGGSSKDFVLFAFGGAGGAYACDIAGILNIQKIYTFQQNSVFSAFGSSIMDVTHIYEERKNVVLPDSTEQFNEIVSALQKRALTDMRGEGFNPDEIRFSLELDTDSDTAMESPQIKLDGDADAKALADELKKSGGRAEIINFRLRAASGIEHYQPLKAESAGEDPQKALKGKRSVYWEGGLKDTDVFERSSLECGNVVNGPSIIEAEDTTYIIPTGWKFKVDSYLNGIIEKEA